MPHLVFDLVAKDAKDVPNVAVDEFDIIWINLTNLTPFYYLLVHICGRRHAVLPWEMFQLQCHS